MHLADTAPAAQAFPKSFLMDDYRPERRRHSRRELNLAGAARRLDNTVHARREPHLPLLILDVSEGGIGATSQSPVFAGERLSVAMPPGSGLPGRVFGRVSRCDPHRGGWLLAIAFDAIPAA